MASKFVQTSLDIRDWKRLKMYCIESDMQISELLNEIVLRWISQQKKTKKGV